MKTLSRPAELSDYAGCHLVPTMGALHDGHASLIRRARESADPILRSADGATSTIGAAAPKNRAPVVVASKHRAPVVVTIFVNPTQFAPHEDFARYPRTLDADLALARDAGADAVFVPSVETIYPHGLDAAQRDAASWDLPPAATEPGLEDRVRPGHFGGVCLVVARLFELCRPRRAFFGEKDWQQLRVVTQMVERERTHGRPVDCAERSEHGAPRARPVRRDADGGKSGARFDDVEIIPCPTVREADGLAMSSRNRYLAEEERRRATVLWRGIQAAQAALSGIAHVGTPAAERAASVLIDGEGLSVDYAVVRDAETLLPVADDGAPPARPLRILIAARLGAVRLIDNAPVRAATASSE